MTVYKVEESTSFLNHYRILNGITDEHIEQMHQDNTYDVWLEKVLSMRPRYAVPDTHDNGSLGG